MVVYLAYRTSYEGSGGLVARKDVVGNEIYLITVFHPKTTVREVEPPVILCYIYSSARGNLANEARTRQ